MLTDAAARGTDRLRFPRHVVNKYVNDREQDAPATVLCDRRCRNVSPLTGLEKGNSTNPGRRSAVVTASLCRWAGLLMPFRQKIPAFDATWIQESHRGL